MYRVRLFTGSRLSHTVSITRTILSMLYELGLKVVAEGAETA